MRLDDNTRNFVKSQVLETLNVTTAQSKSIVHKVCNLAVEIQGAMQEHEDDKIWQELLNLVFTFVNEEVDTKVDAGLQIFTGLFSYIIDYLSAHTADLGKIFEKTLQHRQLDIKLSALQATCNYLGICERKAAKPFKALLPLMTQVISQALAEDEETVLEDALVEFNELAEIEPGFFKSQFKELYQGLKPIAGRDDFTNHTIRH